MTQTRRFLPIFFLLFSLVISGFGQETPDSLVADSLVTDSLDLASDSLEFTDSVAAVIADSVRTTLLATDVDADIDPTDKEGFGLGTPYETMYTLLFFLQEDTYYPELAALTLYQKDLKEGQGEKLAVKLKEYLDGSGNWIDLEEVPTDSNYADSTGKHRYFPVYGEDLLYMYKQGDFWVFSRRTVQAIPQLHRGVFPFGKFSNTVPDWGHKKAGPLKLWQWIGLIVFILLAFLLYSLFTKMLSLIQEKILSRWVKHEITRKIYDKVSRPLSLFVVAWLLRLFMPVLELPASWSRVIITGFKIVVPVFSVLVFYNLVDLVAAFLARRAEKTEGTLDDQLVPLLRKLGKGVVIILGLLLILDNLKVDVTALLAGLSIGGLALALAAQDTVKNFFGSVMIFLDRPFQVGDWIIADGVEGVVEEVGVRSSRIRTFANSLIYIPNAQLADGAINNYGLRAYRRFTTKIGLTYDTPPDKLEAFVKGLRELVRHHPTTRKDYYEIYFNEMGASSLNILLYAFFEVPTWSDELKGKQDLLLGIMRLAETLGVSFAFPTQTLHMETFPGSTGLTPSHPGSKEDFDQKVNAFILEWRARQEAAPGRDEGNEKAWAGGGEG